jgi:hypothetical protein
MLHMARRKEIDLRVRSQKESGGGTWIPPPHQTYDFKSGELA